MGYNCGRHRYVRLGVRECGDGDVKITGGEACDRMFVEWRSRSST